MAKIDLKEDGINAVTAVHGTGFEPREWFGLHEVTDLIDSV